MCGPQAPDLLTRDRNAHCRNIFCYSYLRHTIPARSGGGTHFALQPDTWYDMSNTEDTHLGYK